MKIKDFALSERPRERLKEEGIESLSKSELLAVILQKGSYMGNVLEISNKLLAKYDNLSDCSLRELCSIPGVGKAKAMQIMALFEFSKRSNSGRICEKIVNNASDVAKYYMERLKDKKKEYFIAVFLDTRNKIICDKVISIGTLNSSMVHPREVFKEAIKNSANSIILVHNHPSGDPNPSSEDISCTTELIHTAKILNLKFEDHIIVGKESWKKIEIIDC